MKKYYWVFEIVFAIIMLAILNNYSKECRDLTLKNALLQLELKNAQGELEVLNEHNKNLEQQNEFLKGCIDVFKQLPKKKIDDMESIILKENPSLGGESKLIAMSYYAVSSYYDIEPAKLMSIGRVETIFNSDDVSHVGAQGIHQFMPSTMKLMANKMELKKYNSFDIITNIAASAEYLEDLEKQLTPDQAIVYYNEGGTINKLRKVSTTSLIQSKPYLRYILKYQNKYTDLLKIRLGN